MARKSFKAEAKDRVNDLQGVFSELQNARRECRTSDLAILEEQLHLMLREWKSELHNPSSSSATSSLVATPSSSELSSDMKRLLQLTEEDDDASSSLAACLTKPMLGSHQNQLSYCSTEELYTVNAMHVHEQTPEEEVVERLLRSETIAESSPLCDESLDAQLRMPSFSIQEPFVPKVLFSGIGYAQDEIHMSLPKMSFSSPSAFLGPKCALWDCPRPANGLDLYQDYCSAFHASLAISEGVIAKTPVVRPGGINLKDGPLFSALSAKSQHKLVGIPECEGAATSKSPWNAHDLFDISVLYGEAIREWLFFDKPRRAFESGTRKQRSLPDYNGRGWHESRKQIIKELGGLKRSYYMDPQPDSQFEWHLYEYEIMDYNACALYRLELKQVNMNKKGSKQRLHHEQVRALENEIGRLPSDLSVYDKKMSFAPEEVKRTSRRREKVNYSNKRNSVTMESPILIQNIKSLDFSLEDVSTYLATP